MNSMKAMKITALAAALAGSMMLAGSAHAVSLGTISADFVSVSPTGTGQGVGGGVFNFLRQPGGTFTGTLLPDSPVGAFVGICLDIKQTVDTGVATYDIRTLDDAPVPGTPMGAAKAADLAKLVGSALGGMLASASSLSNVNAAGLQLAVWEIVNETTSPYSIYDGNFKGAIPSWENPSAAALAAAEAYLTAFKSYVGPSAVGLAAMINERSQDFLVQTVVPIPAAAWLLGSGLLALFGVARRRRS
jgi:hypothetical protein